MARMSVNAIDDAVLTGTGVGTVLAVLAILVLVIGILMGSLLARMKA